MDTHGTLTWDALATYRHHRAERDGSPESASLAIVMLAARAEGYTVEDIASRTGLSRQGVYDALHTVGFGEDVPPLGTTYQMVVAPVGLVRALAVIETHNLMDTEGSDPISVHMPTYYTHGRIRREDGWWSAMVGKGGSSRNLPGRHATKTEAVLVVLAALLGRRAELREQLAGDERTTLLAEGILD